MPSILDEDFYYESKKGPKKTKLQGQSARQSIRKVRKDMLAQKAQSLHRREALRTSHRPQRGVAGIEAYEVDAVVEKNYEKVGIPKEELKHAEKAKSVYRITEKAARKGVSITPKEVAGRLAKIAGKFGKLGGFLGPLGTVSMYQEFREGMKRKKKRVISREDYI